MNSEESSTFRRCWAETARLMVKLFCFFFLLAATAARADYMPFGGAEVAPNVAEFHVDENGVHLQLEVYYGDIPKFAALIPDDWLTDSERQAPIFQDRIKKFAQSGLSLKRDDGTPLPIQVKTVEPRMRVDRSTPLSGKVDPYSGRRFPEPPEDQRVLYADLFYDFEGTKPGAITLTPPMGDNGKPDVSIGMVLFDRDVPVTSFKFLSGPARLNINWDDPWYSHFANRNLRRHHESAAMTFLYVEPREVRHESLIRVRDLANFIGEAAYYNQGLNQEDQQNFKAAAIDFLTSDNTLTLDGKQASAHSGRAEFLKITTNGLEVLDNPELVDPSTTMLGVILSYPVDVIPQEAVITWNLFNDRILKVPATLTDPAGPFLSGATPDAPEIKWTNHLLAYEEPVLSHLTTSGADSIRLPVLTLAFALVALIVLVFAMRKNGRTRLILSGLSIACLMLAGLFYGRGELAFANPLQITPDAEAATAIFATLLNNINIAGYEVLADRKAAILEPVLAEQTKKEVLAEIERGLSIPVVGGGYARSDRVEDVTLTEIRPRQSGPGFSAVATWTARAGAGHWGHNHRRNVAYQAVVELENAASEWKLAGLTILSARQLE